MDTHNYNYVEQEAAKDLTVIEPSSHPEISHVKLLGVSAFHFDLNALRIDQT